MYFLDCSYDPPAGAAKAHSLRYTRTEKFPSWSCHSGLPFPHLYWKDATFEPELPICTFSTTLKSCDFRAGDAKVYALGYTCSESCDFEAGRVIFDCTWNGEMHRPLCNDRVTEEKEILHLSRQQHAAAAQRATATRRLRNMGWRSLVRSPC